MQPRPPCQNALKHGLYSESILLPGDDVEAFRRRRLALFHTYRPQTEDEAECVETMAECRWLLNRCRPVQAAFDLQLQELAADAAGRLCEPDGHRRLHSSMDVTVHRQRNDRILCRARSKLLELQKLRRQGLIAGAVQLPPGCYMDASGAVIGPVTSPESAPGARPISVPVPGRDAATLRPSIELAERCVSGGITAASGSRDGEIGKSLERKQSTGLTPAPLAQGVARREEPGRRQSGGPTAIRPPLSAGQDIRVPLS